MEKKYSLKKSDFIDLKYESETEMSEECLSMFYDNNFNYYFLNQENRDKSILNIIDNINNKSWSTSGEGQTDRWKKGWSEACSDFVKNDYDVKFLVPKFIKSNKNIVLRLNKCFISPENSEFELNWYKIYRRFIFDKYFKDFDNIFEFGCGTSFNLIELRTIYPDKNLFGFDWVQPSMDIIGLLNTHHGFDIHGSIFNMFIPDRNISIPPNSIFLTVGSMEQLGTKFRSFLDFILEKKPVLCVHIEPIVELWDRNNLLDYLSIIYHRRRNYLDGYLQALRDLQNSNQIRIIKESRSLFGSFYYEGYSNIIWKPI